MAVNNKDDDVNSLSSDDTFGLADLKRLEEQYANQPHHLRHLKAREETHLADRETLDKHVNKNPNVLFDPVWRKASDANYAALPEIRKRIFTQEEAARERFNERAVNSVSREYSETAVGSYMRSNANTLESQVAGASRTTQGYTSLAEQSQNIRGHMQTLRQESMHAAGSYIGESGVNQESAQTLQTNAAQMKVLAQQLMPITLGMDQLKQQGLDPQGRQRSLITAGDKAAGLLSYNKLEDDMKTGKGLGAFSPSELKKKEQEAAEKLIKALEELRNSAGKTSEELEGLNKKAEEAAEEFENVTEARGMDGGGGRKFEDAKVIAGAVMESLSAITTGFSNIAIQQPLQMASNVQGAANIENEKYDMWHRAIAGDMTARMTLGAWDTGNQFGNQLAGRQNAVHIAKEVNAGIGTLVGGVQIVAGAGGVVGNNVVTTVAQGTQTAIGSIVEGIQQETARERQTERGALRIQGTHAMVNAAKAINHIPGQQLQKYRDYVMGLNAAADQIGGGAGEAFLNETSGTDFIGRMKEQGVGLKEMGSLSAQGAAGMGSMFKSSQVIDAVGLENLGHGSAAENMRRMSMLGAAGTQDPSQNLSKLIEEGMQRGLDSSKAIDMMVDNTARMTEENAKLGGMADPTDFLTKTILGAIDKNNPNKEMAENIAYQTYQSGEAARSNISASFPGMINVARVTKAAGLGTDQAAGLMMTQMSTAMLNSHEKDTPEQFKAFLEQRGMRRGTIEGLGSQLDDPKKYIEGINAAKAVSELSQKSGLGLVSGLPGKLVDEIRKNKDKPEILEALAHLKNPNDLPTELRDLRAPIAQALSVSGQNPDAVFSDVIANLGITLPKENTNTLATEAQRNKSRMSAQVERRGGNQAEMDQVARGGSGLGAGGASGAGGITALAESLRTAFEKAGTNAEEAWTTAAAKTAGAFGDSSKSLNHASGQLDKAAAALLHGAGAMQLVSESFESTVKGIVNKMTGKTSKHLNELKKRIKK